MNTRLFDIFSEIRDSQTVTNSKIVELLTQVKLEFSKAEQKKAEPRKWDAEETVKKVHQLQKYIDDNRHKLKFVNTHQPSDDGPAQAMKENAVAIQLPTSVSIVGKQIVLLIGWSATDRLLQKRYSQLRKKIMKNTWSHNKKMISKRNAAVTSWLERMAVSDQFGLYPYDPPISQVDWSQLCTKVNQAMSADLNILDGIASSKWPNSVVGKAYSGLSKADVFYPWAVRTLNDMLRTCLNKPKQQPAIDDLIELYRYFGVDLDFDVVRKGKKKRIVDGREPQYEPMYIWNTFDRLEAFIDK